MGKQIVHRSIATVMNSIRYLFSLFFREIMNHKVFIYILIIGDREYGR